MTMVKFAVKYRLVYNPLYLLCEAESVSFVAVDAAMMVSVNISSQRLRGIV